MAPFAVTWMSIYERLGTRRLGTASSSISFVDGPSQGSLEHSLWIPLGKASVVYYIAPLIHLHWIPLG
jgi:hypothetical protein